jgi:hypothetical protein
MRSFSTPLVFSLPTLNHNKMFPLYISGVVKGRVKVGKNALRSRAYNNGSIHSTRSVRIGPGWMGLVWPLARMVDSRRRQMFHATFREQLCPRMNCDIAPNKPLLYSRLEINKGLVGKEKRGPIPYILLPRDDCTLHHSSTTKWRRKALV